MADPDSMHSSCTSTSCKQCNSAKIDTLFKFILLQNMSNKKVLHTKTLTQHALKTQIVLTDSIG